MKKYLPTYQVKFNWLLLVFFTLSFNVNAQENKNVKFIETVHDFGDLKEEVGQATYEFKFKNAGSVPIKLTDVKASCGCTTPDWTKDEVAPGKDGIVKATYNTTNRPGPSRKLSLSKRNLITGKKRFMF
jgi:ribonuclease PH